MICMINILIMINMEKCSYGVYNKLNFIRFPAVRICVYVPVKNEISVLSVVHFLMFLFSVSYCCRFRGKTFGIRVFGLKMKCSFCFAQIRSCLQLLLCCTLDLFFYVTFHKIKPTSVEVLNARFDVFVMVA
jgi:hypothetical protein